MKKRTLAGAVLGIFLLVQALPGYAEKVHLGADTMRYEPGAKTFSVEGNVRITRGKSVLLADRGRGMSDGSFFELEGGVSCEMPERQLLFSCENLRYYPKEEIQRIEAFGKVKARQEENSFEAQEVLWRFGDIPFYTASGDVRASWGDRTFSGGRATRKGDRFWTKENCLFQDRTQDVGIQAPALEGRLEEGELTEAIASGGVVLKTLGARGEPIRITGNKCIYSLERGTLVISGGAFARQGERTMKAENLVMRLKTRIIEAKGKPQLVFTVGDQ